MTKTHKHHKQNQMTTQGENHNSSQRSGFLENLNRSYNSIKKTNHFIKKRQRIQTREIQMALHL